MGLFYGRGAYFSDSAAYCDENYAYVPPEQPRPQQQQRQLILAHVLCGQVKEYGVNIDMTLKFPHAGFDCVRGGPHKFNPAAVHSCNMTVVYDRTQVYPQYIVTYQNAPPLAAAACVTSAGASAGAGAGAGAGALAVASGNTVAGDPTQARGNLRQRRGAAHTWHGGGGRTAGAAAAASAAAAGQSFSSSSPPCVGTSLPPMMVPPRVAPAPSSGQRRRRGNGASVSTGAVGGGGGGGGGVTSKGQFPQTVVLPVVLLVLLLLVRWVVL